MDFTPIQILMLIWDMLSKLLSLVQQGSRSLKPWVMEDCFHQLTTVYFLEWEGSISPCKGQDCFCWALQQEPSFNKIWSLITLWNTLKFQFLFSLKEHVQQQHHFIMLKDLNVWLPLAQVCIKIIQIHYVRTVQVFVMGVQLQQENVLHVRQELIE